MKALVIIGSIMSLLFVSVVGHAEEEIFDRDKMVVGGFGRPTLTVKKFGDRYLVGGSGDPCKYSNPKIVETRDEWQISFDC